MMAGTYTFRWERPAGDVYVTGTFDNWSQSMKMERQGDVFVKTVTLPVQKILYKFVVDGHWTTDPHAPYETEPSGIQNSVLDPSQITPQQPDMSSPFISSAAPNSTTAALAANVPVEPPADDGKHDPTISSAAPGSSTADMAARVPLEQPTPAPESVPGFFPATPAKEEADPAKGEEGQEFSVNPLPASDTPDNPITLKPGEPVPRDIGSQTLTSNVRTDKESYERGATNFPIGSLTLPDVVTPPEQREQKGRDLLDLPPITKNMIPESSLPIESPKEPAHIEVPNVVKQSQEQAHFPPEASEVQESVDKKAEIEKELKQETAVAPPIPTPKPEDTKPQTEPTVTNGVTTATTESTSLPAEVPKPVNDSVKAAGTSAEAASQGVAPITAGPTVQNGSPAKNGSPVKDTSTPPASPNGKESKKGKRRSFFGRLKDKLQKKRSEAS